MEFIKNMPGFKSQNGTHRLIATIYYAVCISLIINYKIDVKLFILILLPFVFELLKTRDKSEEDEEIVKILKSCAIVMSSAFILNISVCFASNIFLEIDDLEKQNKELESQYNLLKEENKKLIENELNSEEYKNKLNYIESEKARLKQENKNLKLEKEALENKLY